MKTYNLFISHSWKYDAQYLALLDLLQRDSSFHFKDYSVPKDSPIHNAPTQKALYDAIKSQMQYAGVILLLGGVYASYSKWIDKEVQIAKAEFSRPKPIVLIRPYQALRITSHKENADEEAAWRSDSIIAAIKRQHQ